MAAYSAKFGELVTVNTTGGGVTVTLPIADREGIVYVKLVAGGSAVTVDGYGSETVDGGANISLSSVGQAATLVTSGNGAWVSIGEPTPIAVLDDRYVQTTEAVNTVAAAGAAETIPEPGEYGLNDITLTADCTVTFPAASKGKTLRMVFRQDGTGNWAVTWPANVIYPGGTNVVISVAANAVDYVEAVCVVEDVWMIHARQAYAV